MSCDNTPQVRVRTRRRALANTEPSALAAPDPFDPGPMINFPPLPTGPDGLPLPPAIKQRVRDLRALDHRAAKEFILRTLHVFLLAHRPMDEIARSFGVSIRQVYWWKSELHKAMGQELKRKLPTDLLAGQLLHYERAKAYAWQQASQTREHAEKRGWVSIALKAEQQISDLYFRTGMLTDATLLPVGRDDEDVTGGAGMLAALSKAYLVGDYAGART